MQHMSLHPSEELKRERAKATVNLSFVVVVVAGRALHGPLLCGWLLLLLLSVLLLFGVGDATLACVCG